jgi:hypothetical protein
MLIYVDKHVRRGEFSRLACFRCLTKLVNGTRVHLHWGMIQEFLKVGDTCFSTGEKRCPLTGVPYVLIHVGFFILMSKTRLWVIIPVPLSAYRRTGTAKWKFPK